MSLVRRAAKRDQSEKAIVEYLRKAGWSVLYLSVANGPDLVLGRFGVNLLAEVKTGKGKLRAGQVEWGRDWRGDPPYVLRTIEEAEALTTASNALSLLSMKNIAKPAYNGAAAAGRNTRHGYRHKREVPRS